MSTREERMARIESSVFKTITDADWARQLPRARATPNAVREKMRERIRSAFAGPTADGAQRPEILAVALGNSPSEGGGNTKPESTRELQKSS